MSHTFTSHEHHPELLIYVHKPTRHAHACRYIATPFVLGPQWRRREEWKKDKEVGLLELLLQQYCTRLMLDFGVQLLEDKARLLHCETPLLVA
jgi:hypothetical protein